ncbi:hydroxyurea phosphotransferase [Streptomyces sp. Ru73]|uniref:aminoglycoside phosphotransferase family protein n=1 Tax=Streptomyces sp. Ru73 TaxID=2080748 RepID=UPI000CDE54F7|nr:aminoglycoside phosphotransferase family protein [Streptomyces sp. Ru73]POX41439.1 hydroxyurea phosphotransferase [Streptomyces sp. Ru73]
MPEPPHPDAGPAAAVPARRPDLFPPGLPVAGTLSRHASGRAWLARLPRLVREAAARWELRLSAPFDGGSCSWAAPVRLPDGGPAVLKVTWPHREAAGEAAALRAWDGHGAVRLLAHDPERHALLLERCVPGTTLLDAVPETDAGPEAERKAALPGAALSPSEAGRDAAPPGAALSPSEGLCRAADVLAELWRAPRPPDGELETVAAVCAEWADLVRARQDRLRPPYDPGLVELGATLLRELPATARRDVVVHGDFNPGNVLAAGGPRGWLAIDPKPMTGDPAYDPWPLLTQLDDPFAHPAPGDVLRARLRLLAGRLGEAPERLAAWGVARSVESALWSAAHDDVPGGAQELAEARTLAEVAGL